MVALGHSLSRRRAAALSTTVALASGVVVGTRFAWPGELVRVPLAALFALFVAPVGYVVARTPREALTPRVLALAALLGVGLLVAFATLVIWLRSIPGMQGVGPTGLLLFAVPAPWLAAAATLRYVDA
ncbi:hypothetical protein [Halobaculum sp. EA56]|uniref:hypothetical protein n=1 Tax=Halobaculum sp. EA56 TaxID=3421648 RepID=UPI003EB9E25E